MSPRLRNGHNYMGTMGSIAIDTYTKLQFVPPSKQLDRASAAKKFKAAAVADRLHNQSWWKNKDDHGASNSWPELENWPASDISFIPKDTVSWLQDSEVHPEVPVRVPCHS